MATTNPCALLERLLSEPRESEWLEFKLNNSNVHEIGAYVSALANSAMLADKDRGFLVFGVEDKTRKKLGTTIKLNDLKKGAENFTNWVTRMIEPRLMMEFLDFEYDGSPFSILCIEPSYDRPVKFCGTEYIRIGENLKKLAEFPHHERSLWLMTSRRKFEEAIALTNQDADAIPELLDIDAFYTLLSEQVPGNISEVIRRFQNRGLLRDNMENKFDITNLGAILLAKDVSRFPSISGKAVRVVNYAGRDKSKSDFEREARMGYAAGFANMMRWLMRRLPKEERYINGVRRSVARYPEIAIREIIANALIHQDFTVSGSGPLIEIYSDRIEFTNPGNSLIATDRLLDERRSRNEKLASLMRDLNICEERGSGLDKAMIEIEQLHLPAPEFVSSANSMRVILFGPRPFNKMSKQEKLRAGFYHCILRWLIHDYMSNATLRERFSLADEDYQATSTIISELIHGGRIIPAEEGQGRRNARYVPYWVGTTE
jgi:ATP-dependent DNA helicase RecG